MSVDLRSSALVVVFCLCAGWLYKRASARSKVPPLVSGLPIIGNLHQVPSLDYLKVEKLKQTYGPIFTLDAAGSFIVIVADLKSAVGLLDKNSLVTSGRPPLRVGSELMAHHLLMSIAPYGDAWKRHRRGASESLAGRASHAFFAVQEDEALRLARGLLESYQTVELERHASRFAASSLWRAFYGGPPLALEGDPNLDTMDCFLNQMMAVLSPTSPEAVADLFPFLLSLPKGIAPFKKSAEEYHTDITSFFNKIIKEACQRRDTHVSASDLNLGATLHERKEKLGLSDKDVAWLAGTLFITGAETTATTLQYFVLAMILCPEVAIRAQVELDEVIGTDSPPTLMDRARLPYVEALVKEVMRWRPVVPLGLPHYAIEDVHYDKYLIPKGTIIVSSLWCICHDPEVFPDPDTFSPERFLNADKDGRYADIPFGFGRRICVGKDVGLSGNFIAIATMLWAFKFSPAKGVELKEERHDTGVTVRPKAFPYELAPRSERVQDILTRSEEGRGL